MIDNTIRIKPEILVNCSLLRESFCPISEVVKPIRTKTKENPIEKDTHIEIIFLTSFLSLPSSSIDIPVVIPASPGSIGKTQGEITLRTPPINCLKNPYSDYIYKSNYYSNKRVRNINCKKDHLY